MIVTQTENTSTITLHEAGWRIGTSEVVRPCHAIEASIHQALLDKSLREYARIWDSLGGER